MNNIVVSLLANIIGLSINVSPWVNEYEEVMDFTCPNYQVLMYLSSFHDSQYEDRRWEMYCRSVDITLNCVASGYVNDWYEPINFTCPEGHALTGIASYHDSNYEDRRFNFTCCAELLHALTDCYTTDYVNELEEKLTLFVPEGQVIRSVHSDYHNQYKDRRFTFELCTF